MPALKNVKEEAFALKRLEGLSIAKSAAAAGFSPARAYQIAKLPRVLARIEELRLQQKNRLEVTADRVKEELARIALVDPASFFNERGEVLPITDMPEDARRAISGFEVEETDYGVRVKIKGCSKEKALEMLGRHFGLFPSDAQVAVNAVGPVQINIGGINVGGGDAQGQEAAGAAAGRVIDVEPARLEGAAPSPSEDEGRSLLDE